MLQKIFITLFISTIAISNLLRAEIEYEIHDIGTLQTHASEAIAINNNGQILGWYDIDGTEIGKHYFVRDRDGSFHEINEEFSKIYENIPPQYKSIKIDWQYLTDNGTVYGTFNLPNTNPVLFMWDRQSGIVKLGSLPGKKISTINNMGQVLLEYVEEANHDGKLSKRPVIWENGKITKLRGLEGNVGIESQECYGIDMNNAGDVVGHCIVLLNYKNKLYTQIHATKWVNGKVIDLHNEVQKSPNSYATAINDDGDIFVDGYLIRKDGQIINMHNGPLKATDKKYFYKWKSFFDLNGSIIATLDHVGDIAHYDKNSIWWGIDRIKSMNDSGEIITQGRTIWGEEHAILLVPKNH